MLQWKLHIALAQYPTARLERPDLAVELTILSPVYRENGKTYCETYLSRSRATPRGNND